MWRRRRTRQVRKTGAVSVASVRLFSDGLLSKWGFGDGDAPGAFYEYFDDQGIDWREVPGWRSLLPGLVRRYLLPVLDQQVEVVEVGTIHNPVRAVRVDGVDVSDCWHKRDHGIRLTPEYVDIPMADVAALAAA